MRDEARPDQRDHVGGGNQADVPSDAEFGLFTEVASMPAVVETAFESATGETVRLAFKDGRIELCSGRGDEMRLAFWDHCAGTWAAQTERVPTRGQVDDLAESTPSNIAYWLLSFGWQIEASASRAIRRVIARPRSVRTGDLADRAWKHAGLTPGSALHFEWVQSGTDSEWRLSMSGGHGARNEDAVDPAGVFSLGLELAPDWLMPDGVSLLPTTHSGGSAVATSALPFEAFQPPPEPDAAELERRRSVLTGWLAKEEFLGPFPDRNSVQARLSVDQMSSVGHYALAFEDGQSYIGETIDFMARFGQHAQTYADIESFFVRPEPPTLECIDSGRDSTKRRLRRVERELIHSAQDDALILRNTMEMAHPIKVAASFSEVVPSADVDRWVRRPDVANAADSATPRPVDRKHAAAREKAFRRFIDLPEAPQTRRIVEAYIQRCVPFPARTEYTSWAISCLPTALRGENGQKDRWSVLCCLSIARTETLTITRHKQTDTVAGFVAVNEVELGIDTELGDMRLARQHPGVKIDSEAHPTFGPGVVLLHAPDLDALEALLDDTRVTRAAATVALRMCRVGPSTQRSAHNPYLVDAAMGWTRRTGD